MNTFRPDDFKLSLDVWIIEFGKVEMIWKMFPFDQIVDTVFMPDITFPSDIGEGLNIGMNGREEHAEVGNVST